MSNESTTLTLEQILAASQPKTQTVEIPDWGGEVTITELSLRKRQEIQQGASVDGSMDELRLAMLTLVHGLVSPAVTEEQAWVMLDGPAGPVEQIVEAILTLSGINEESVKAAEARFRG